MSNKSERPWGNFTVIEDNILYKIKRIEVLCGHKLSYQYHYKRAENWTIVQGNAKVILNGKTLLLNSGDSVKINKLDKHRIENIGSELLIFVEVQIGEYFGEDDIVRLEDDYNRILNK